MRKVRVVDRLRPKTTRSDMGSQACNGLNCGRMVLQFYKYQGTGNDFIMVDNRQGQYHFTAKQIMLLCDRKFGVGSDGLIFIEESNDADFYMNFYNPDGSQSFCGNGSRCAVRFAQQLGAVGERGVLRAIDTLHKFECHENRVHVSMKNVLEIEKSGEDQIIQTGSPHYVIFTSDPGNIDIKSEAHKIRYNDRFREKGINVNFVKEGDGEIWMRTYERGVEDETLSCGTGVTAAALAYASRHAAHGRVKVHAQGGDLEVLFAYAPEGGFENIWLCGPAEFVFEGKIELMND